MNTATAAPAETVEKFYTTPDGEVLVTVNDEYLLIFTSVFGYTNYTVTRTAPARLAEDLTFRWEAVETDRETARARIEQMNGGPTRYTLESAVARAERDA